MESKDYKEICDLVNHVSQISVRYFDKNQSMIFSCPYMDREEDFLQTDTELVQVIFEHCEQVKYPILFATDLNECLAVVPDLTDRVLVGAYIIGPVLTSDVTEASIMQYAREKNLPLQYTYELMRKYKTIPVMSLDRFGALPKLLYYYVYQKPLDTSNMTLISGIEDLSRNMIESVISEAAFDAEETQRFSRGAFLYKNDIEDFIRQGKPTELKEYIAVTDPCRILAFSRKNPLWQSKCQFIYYLSIALGASIQGGLSAEKVCALGELYAQKMEMLTNLTDVESLRLQMMLELAERVRYNGERNRSQVVQMCCEYIADHIYGDITVSKLADYAGVSGNYLSTVFRKEKRENITSYIQRHKILEAQNLMKHTGQSSWEISQKLGFHSQSYFCTVFKKYAGMTPGKWKLSQKIHENL